MGKYEEYSSIGTYIKENRKRLRLTRKQLAEKVGLSEASIIKYENHERYPKMEQIRKMADIFGIPPKLMMDGYTYQFLVTSEDLLNNHPFLAYMQTEGSLVKYHNETNEYQIYIENFRLIPDGSIKAKSYLFSEKDLDWINSEIVRYSHLLISLKGREYGTELVDYGDIDKILSENDEIEAAKWNGNIDDEE